MQLDTAQERQDLRQTTIMTTADVDLHDFVACFGRCSLLFVRGGDIGLPDPRISAKAHV